MCLVHPSPLLLCPPQALHSHWCWEFSPENSGETLAHKRAQGCPISQSIRPRKLFKAGKNGRKPVRMEAPRRNCHYFLLLEGPGMFLRAQCMRVIRKRDSLAIGLHPECPRAHAVLTHKTPKRRKQQGHCLTREHHPSVSGI